jgi:hypothetical protein
MWWVRSRARSRSSRYGPSPWGQGQWGRGHEVGEVEGAKVKVTALRAMSVRLRLRGWGLGCRGRGHRLEGEVGEVEAARWARSPPWGRSWWGPGHELEGEVVSYVGEGEVTVLRPRPPRSVRSRAAWGLGMGIWSEGRFSYLRRVVGIEYGKWHGRLKIWSFQIWDKLAWEVFFR